MSLISQRTPTAIALGAFLLAFSNTVWASPITLPAYSFSATTQYGINTIVFGSYTDNNPIGGQAAGSSTVSGFGQPFPILSAASNTAGINGTTTSDARASLTYTFEVFGPPGTVQIAFNSMGTVAANSSQPAFGQSYFLVADSRLSIPALSLTDETLIKFTNTGQSCCFPPSTQDQGLNSSGTPATGFNGFFTDTQTLTLTANIAYAIIMSVQASTTGSGSVPNNANNGLVTTASATIDPIFSLAPSVINPGQYTLGFSPGIGNTTAATPEPASFVLIGLGLLGLGIVERFKRA